MHYSKLQYINEQGGILAHESEGVALYIPPNDWRYAGLLQAYGDRIEPYSREVGPVDANDVQDERDRRILQRLVIPLGEGVQAFTFGNSLIEKEFLRSTAMLVGMQGTTEDVMITDATGYVHMLPPDQLLHIFTEVTLYETEVMNAAMFMADAPDIPEDYAADERWPSTLRN